MIAKPFDAVDKVAFNSFVKLAHQYHLLRGFRLECALVDIKEDTPAAAMPPMGGGGMPRKQCRNCVVKIYGQKAKGKYYE